MILWVSSYGFQSKPKTRDPGYWSWSDDHGESWAPFVRFDNDPSRSVYTSLTSTKRQNVFWRPGRLFLLPDRKPKMRTHSSGNPRQVESGACCPG